MAKLRVDITLNPGGEGVQLRKLADIASDFEKLLRSLAHDMGIEAKIGDWISKDFKNSSVHFGNEFVGPVDTPVVHRFNRNLKGLVNFAPEQLSVGLDVSGSTINSFTQLGRRLEGDEILNIGIYDEPDKPTDYKLRKATAVAILEELQRPIQYVGSLQGKTATWYKEKDYFNLRVIRSGAVVKCHYTNDKYRRVYDLYQNKDAIIHVSGLVTGDRIEKIPLEIKVNKVEVFQPLTDDEFREFYGIAPGLTGDESAPDFIERIREDDDI